MKTYFLHGHNIQKDGSKCSFWTEEVEHKDAPLRHHLLGLSYTATGYGSAIPSRVMVKFRGRWRRVYVRIYGNSGTAYIKTAKNESITVQEYDE